MGHGPTWSLLNPAEHPPGDVDADDRAALVAGEEAALTLQTTLNDEVFVGVTEGHTLALQVKGISPSHVARISG